MKAGKLITGLLAFFLVCALVTGQCLCASTSVLSVIIYEEVSNAYGPVWEAHRCDPVGTVFPDSGDSVVVHVHNGWIDTLVCTLDGDVIYVGNYSWGSWVISEGATFTLSSVTESHVIRFTFAENYGQS